MHAAYSFWNRGRNHEEHTNASRVLNILTRAELPGQAVPPAASRGVPVIPSCSQPSPQGTVHQDLLVSLHGSLLCCGLHEVGSYGGEAGTEVELNLQLGKLKLGVWWGLSGCHPAGGGKISILPLLADAQVLGSQVK